MMAIMGFLALGTSGCIRALPGEDPPDAARLYYPARMALSQDGNTAYVVNVNFDQRFNSSWVTEVDLAELIGRAVANDAPFAALRQGVHVPGLGGDLAFNAAGTRAYLAHRGSGLLTVFDAAPGVSGSTHLTCGQKPEDTGNLTHAEAHTDCDGAHLMRLKQSITALDHSQKDPSSRRYDDPYAVTTVEQGNTTAVFVGFLNAGRISVLEDAGGALPTVSGYVNTPASGVARLLATPQGLLFGASKAAMIPSLGLDAGQSHLVGVNLLSPAGLFNSAAIAGKGGLAGQSYTLSMALGSQQNSDRAGISGLVASAEDGNRFFVLSQRPDAVTLIDVSRPPKTQSAADGAVTTSFDDLSYALMGAEAVAHSTLSDVVYIPRASSDLVAVTSLAQDMVYFFDPSYADLQMVHRIHLKSGQGPVGLLPVNVGGKEYLLVSTFFDHGLTVLDISQANFTDFTVLTSIHDESFAVAPRVR